MPALIAEVRADRQGQDGAPAPELHRARLGDRRRVLHAAGPQSRLWKATDLFYRNQGEENSGYVTDQFLTEGIDGAGADAARPSLARGTRR